MLTRAIGADWKGRLSPLIYVAGIGACFVDPRLGLCAYVLVALIWLIPDRRIERAMEGGQSNHGQGAARKQPSRGSNS